MTHFSSSHEEILLELEVLRVQEVAHNIIELEFASTDGAPLPEWSAGAHFDLRLKEGLSRQYSLMRGTINPNNWRIAVLVEEDGRGGSLYIKENLKKGAVTKGFGPRNHFPLTPADEYLFIAGGIGITPLLEMIREAESSNIPWTLKYLGGSPSAMAYVDSIQKEYGDKAEVFAKSLGQRLDLPEVIESASAGTHVYCCGPERLMIAVEESLAASPERAHVERFHPKEIVLTEPDKEFTVYCKKSDVELLVPADESILMAADFEGIDIPGDCMEGTCGSCETRVIEGEVDHRDSVLSAQARAEGDTMMICISRAMGNRLVIDL